jgi:hypothetical protein
MELKGSRTEKNLLTAFAGESQARNRYSYFASQAKKDGFAQIQAIFGVPIYVCATASIPIAAGFLHMGASFGAVLAFLIAGPATNAATHHLESVGQTYCSAVSFHHCGKYGWFWTVARPAGAAGGRNAAAD